MEGDTSRLRETPYTRDKSSGYCARNFRDCIDSVRGTGERKCVKDDWKRRNRIARPCRASLAFARFLRDSRWGARRSSCPRLS